MAFDRKSMEQIVQDMVDWTKGTTKKLTDFRIGSRNRSLLEAVGKEIEEYYDRMYRAIKTLIEDNVYTVMGFPKRPAVYATGTVSFGRGTAADTDYLITIGTVVKTKATATKSPVTFRTTQDVILATGQTTVNCPVICEVPGTDGNAGAGLIVDFTLKPSGIETVTNAVGFTTGQEEETRDEQKNRFQKFIASLSRGTLAAIEYGATTAQLVNSGGLPTERVVEARAFEDLVTKLGQVDCYLWNGVGTASPALLTEAEKIVFGYIGTDGKLVYGYKPAGIIVHFFSATTKPVTIRLTISPETGVVLNDLKPLIEQEIADFFGLLKQGGTLIQTALETRIKVIAGVYDVKVALSIDNGVTYTDGNLTSGATEILVPKSPYIYV